MPITDADLPLFAEAVATALPDDWKADPTPQLWGGMPARLLTHPGGGRIMLTLDTAGKEQEPRLRAIGRLPDPPGDVNPYTADLPSAGAITVAPVAKPPRTAAQRVADHIRRRLLPELHSAVSTWREQVAKLRWEEAQRREVAERIAAVKGMSAPVRRTRTHFPDDDAYYLQWKGAPRLHPITTADVQVKVDYSRLGEAVTVCIEATGLTGSEAAPMLRALLDTQPPAEATEGEAEPAAGRE